jgi:hypothetical protein
MTLGSPTVGQAIRLKSRRTRNPVVPNRHSFAQASLKLAAQSIFVNLAADEDQARILAWICERLKCRARAAKLENVSSGVGIESHEAFGTVYAPGQLVIEELLEVFR